MSAVYLAIDPRVLWRAAAFVLPGDLVRPIEGAEPAAPPAGTH